MCSEVSAGSVDQAELHAVVEVISASSGVERLTNAEMVIFVQSHTVMNWLDRTDE